MVRIIGAKVSQNNEGKSFVSLKLQGGVEAVQSQKTGKMYLTAKTCSIPSTFDEPTAKALIGTEFSGTIERVSAEPYEYTVKETGEVITLTHSYQYRPERIPEEKVEQFQDEDSFSMDRA